MKTRLIPSVVASKSLLPQCAPLASATHAHGLLILIEVELGHVLASAHRLDQLLLLGLHTQLILDSGAVMASRRALLARGPNASLRPLRVFLLKVGVLLLELFLLFIFF